MAGGNVCPFCRYLPQLGKGARFSLPRASPARQAPDCRNLVLRSKQVRSYASQSPTVRRNERRARERREGVGRVRAPEGHTATSLFKDVEIPSTTFWTGHIALTGPTNIPAKEYAEVLTTYRELANQSGSGDSWKPYLETHMSVPHRTLYYASCIAIFAGGQLPQKGKVALGRLAFHALKTLCDLGYAPAVLTLRRLAMSEPASDDRSILAFRRDVSRHFMELVKVGRSADVLTLQGELCVREGRDAQALEYFRRAIAVGNGNGAEVLNKLGEEHVAQEARAMAKASEGKGRQKDGTTLSQQSEAPKSESTTRIGVERQPLWAWEALCTLGIGSILRQQGRLAPAVAAFRTAAMELDSREGYQELGISLPPGDPEKESHLIKAAVSGSKEACGALAELVKHGVAESGAASSGSTWRSRLKSTMLREWSTLAS
jgi:tetratricopeptide (TPR) repeat protein